MEDADPCILHSQRYDCWCSDHGRSHGIHLALPSYSGLSTRGITGLLAWSRKFHHYSDVIMSPLASQITGVSTVYSSHLFRRRSKKTSKLRVTGLCEGNSPVTGEVPTQRASNAENVSIWWRHHNDKLVCIIYRRCAPFRILNSISRKTTKYLTHCMCKNTTGKKWNICKAQW